MHSILARQMRRLEVSPDAAPTLEAWRALLERISKTYEEADHDRYKLERSQQISSEEMASLHDRLRRHNLELEQQVETRTQSLRAMMERAEAAASSKAAFLANMSHEIRTPLNAIIGFAELLARRAEAGPAQRDEWIGIVHNSATHLLGLINDVLDYSKLDAGMMAVESVPCDVIPTISQCLLILQERALEKGISVQLITRPGCPVRILTDPTRLRQIVVNLVSNAIKFTERGGVLVSIEGAGGAADPRLRVAVKDTGIGMSQHQVAQLFTPFVQADTSTTRRYGGTGLGLSIARSLARKLGGEITVESMPGEGSTFTLEVAATPLRPTDPAVGRPPAAENPVPHLVQALRGRRVLLVDDNTTNLKLFSVALARAGAEVSTAENGDLALRVAATSLFDLVVMDMQMPVMDGFEATRRLRARGFPAPILAVTAMSSGANRDRCIECGCSEFLAKPVSLDALVEVARRLVTSPDAPAPRVAGTPASAPPDGPRTAAPAAPAVHPPRAPDEPDELLRTIALGWLAEFPQRLDELASAIAAADTATIARIAHAIRGTSATIGLPQFEAPAARLEETALQGALVAARAALEDLRATLERSRVSAPVDARA